MKIKKTIAVFLIVVVILQALPLKQAVRYFFDDHFTAEEALPTNEKETKNCRFLDDAHNFINEFSQPSSHLIVTGNLAYFHYAENLPDFHSADIQTPPPNFG